MRPCSAMCGKPRPAGSRRRLLLAAGLLAAAGCGQGPELINEDAPAPRPMTLGDVVMKRAAPPDPRTNTVQTEVRRKAVEETFTAPLIYANPVAQVEFERQFYFLRDLFRTPRIGSLLPIKKITGEVVWANLSVVRSNYVEVLRMDRIETLDKQDLDMETQSMLYTNVFAATFAKQRIDDAFRTGDMPTTNLPIRTLAATNRIEDRLLIQDLDEVYMGPGIMFVTRPVDNLLRGVKVRPVERYGDWVLVSRGGRNEPLGWIPWFSTMSAAGEDLAGMYRDVSFLIASGLVVEVDPAQRRVWVNNTQWDSSMAHALDGICRTLADYTQMKIGGKSTRLDVYGADNGKRLATYNRIYGLKRLE